MNIQKLEIVLDEMRRAKFADAASAETLVRRWADQIAGAISDHLIAELGGSPGDPSAPGMSGEPSGHGWDEIP